MKHRAIGAQSVLIALLIGCAPQEFIVQHAEKGDFSKWYANIGVYCDRTNVTLHSWANDSVAIAVTMRARAKPSYSFVVDSVSDSLLLIGKYAADPQMTEAAIPTADIAAPRNVNAIVRVSGSVEADNIEGELDVSATDTVSIRFGKFTSPARCVSTEGVARIFLPADFSGKVDMESGAGSVVQCNSPNFQGSKSPAAVQGTIGRGGAQLYVRAKKGIIVTFY